MEYSHFKRLSKREMKDGRRGRTMVSWLTMRKQAPRRVAFTFTSRSMGTVNNNKQKRNPSV